ncbi:hypothetical protein ROU88_02725 [Macrococcus capreoli]|uniref:hypothetical protein n=1 Tax=Macrococcus capreoli TaxID=2982690 RepID=UPI0021D5CF17|nr:hypothetical protein [Macrococcus sp. TMW 2.2395]MCU7556293.1 hypothetical protein [Macrococcus sp. TMW 2.2395]
MKTQKFPLKRWTFIDTLNTCVLIYVILFFKDINKNPTLTIIIFAAIAIWIITVIAKNVIISKQNDTHQNK